MTDTHSTDLTVSSETSAITVCACGTPLDDYRLVRKWTVCKVCAKKARHVRQNASQMQRRRKIRLEGPADLPAEKIERMLARMDAERRKQRWRG